MAYDISVSELSEADPIAPQPENINVTLKRHQLTLLHRCRQYESEELPLSQFQSLLSNHSISSRDYMRTRVGILGDHVGSGKSFVLLSLVLTSSDIHAGPALRSYGCNQVLLCKQDQTRSLNTSLLVIPHNLCAQWTTYIDTFSSNLKYLMINKNRMVHSIVAEDISTYDLVVVTSTFYNRVASILTSRNLKMRRVLFDEVDDINIPSCMPVDSEFYWFVTASYGNLIWPRGYNKWDPSTMRCIWHATGIKNSGFIKTLFSDLSNNVDREVVKILVVRNKPEYVQQSMILPAMDARNVLCKTPPSINILNGLVARQIIDALNGGDISSAMQFVNPHNRTSEDGIIQVLIDKYSRNLHNLNERLELCVRIQYESEDDRAAERARVEAQIADVQRRIDSIKERIRSTNTCCICFDAMQNKCVVPCCSNSYCFECISRWLTSGRTPACPMCKHVPLRMDDLMLVQADLVPAPERPAPPSRDQISEMHDKLQNLEAILLNRQEHSKFLIFSSYDNTLNNIVPVLDRLEMRHSCIRGNHAVVRNTVDKYRNSDLDALLVNASQYGSGLNLENTTDVVLFHRFGSEIEKQVIGRAQRLGRTQPLRVWYLLHDVEMQQS
jgi:SNF2 family DNA or RNA helicase